MYLSTKLMFEKTSAMSFDKGDMDFAQGISKGIGQSIGNTGIGAIRRLIGTAAQSINEKLIGDPRRERIVDNIINTDPDVANAEAQQPGISYKLFGTMRKFAPTLSRDPNIVTSFLREAAITGGSLNYNTVKGLAEAEAMAQRAKNEGTWLRGDL
jgi:hypothetical protein